MRCDSAPIPTSSSCTTTSRTTYSPRLEPLQTHAAEQRVVACGESKVIRADTVAGRGVSSIVWVSGALFVLRD